MTTALAHTHVLSGLSTQPVRVEADLANGLPQFSIVGLPSTAVREARDRVRAALVNAGFGFPDRRVTVNLAPADLPKDSGRFDLAIALAILAADGKIPNTSLQKWVLAGELSLSGDLLPIRAAFAFGLSVVRGLNQSLPNPMRLMAPLANARELALLDAAHQIVCVDSLAHACQVLQGTCVATGAAAPAYAKGAPVASVTQAALDAIPSPDEHMSLRWEMVRGQAPAQYAALVAAAGHHSLLLMGPPGVGKSMIAERLVTLLPTLPKEQAQEVFALQSLDPSSTTTHANQSAWAGAGDNPPLGPIAWARPPYRAPHHTTSAKALIGGGNPIRPGEVSLAHHGVLFLDELPEFSRDALESLREPLQTGEVRVVRVRERLTLPARVLLVAAMNPCPCGFYGVKGSRRPCRCTAEQVARYQGRLSGPLLDRFDLAVGLQSVARHPNAAPTTETVMSDQDAEILGLSTEARQSRVAQARQRALTRQGCPNAQLSAQSLAQMELVQPEALALLAQVAERTDMSLRVVERLKRVALTLADLSGSDRVGLAQMAQAIDLRRGLDRPVALGVQGE